VIGIAAHADETTALRLRDDAAADAAEAADGARLDERAHAACSTAAAAS
jgi:hypothetical protein